MKTEFSELFSEQPAFSQTARSCSGWSFFLFFFKAFNSSQSFLFIWRMRGLLCCRATAGRASINAWAVKPSCCEIVSIDWFLWRYHSHLWTCLLSTSFGCSLGPTTYFWWPVHPVSKSDVHNKHHLPHFSRLHVWLSGEMSGVEEKVKTGSRIFSIWSAVCVPDRCGRVS